MDDSETTGMDMNPYPETENDLQSVAVISIVAVLNIITWMVMITGIAVGAKHLDHCPIQPNIPIYMIVMGMAVILALLVTYTRAICENPLAFFATTVCMALLHFHNFCWLITGSVWIYSLYPPNYNPENLYCHKTTYRFAFGMTTMVWATMGFLIILGFCCGVTRGWRSDDAIIPDHSPYEQFSTAHSSAGDV